MTGIAACRGQDSPMRLLRASSSIAGAGRTILYFVELVAAAKGRLMHDESAVAKSWPSVFTADFDRRRYRRRLVCG